MASNDPFVDKTGEFGAKDIAPSTSNDSFMKSAEVQAEVNAAIATDAVKQPGEKKVWKPGTAQRQADQVTQASTERTKEVDERTDAQLIAELEDTLTKLRAATGLDGVKIVKPNPKAKLDFTKITEKDVFNLNIPIEAIEHHVPDLTRIELKDKNYIARYINIHPGRMGPMKAAGFTFITPEDIESMAMEIHPDENGQYRYIDTVAMKCPKIKYLGALRANYERALKTTDKNVLHKIMQKKTAEMLGSREMGERDENNPDYGKNYKQDAQKYQAENKLAVYI